MRDLQSQEAEFTLALAPEGMQISPQSLLVTVDTQSRVRFGDFAIDPPIESYLYHLYPGGNAWEWQQKLTIGLQVEMQSHHAVESIIITVPPDANLQIIAIIAASLQSKSRCFLRVEK
jgi:hypothetical protein